MSNFRTQALGTSLGSGMANFFTITGGGTCPNFSGTVPYINFDWSMTTFCSEFATNALLLLRAAFLVVCAFFAFRVAVDN